MPDTAHNNQFDTEASTFFYRRVQEIGIPLVVVTRFAAYASQVPRDIYDRMAATGLTLTSTLTLTLTLTPTLTFTLG